ASLTVNTVRLSDDYFGANNDMRSLDGVELDIRNLSTTYHVPTTPNTRINKDHSLDNGCTQEEGIHYDEVFALVARIEAIRLFLAYASFIGSLVYQIDIKSAFLYERTDESVYVCQPPGFEDPDYPDKNLDGIFIRQDKYVDEILRKFKYEDVKPASTSMDKQKALLKDSDGDDVDVHLYKSMIGSLMYLTSSKPDIINMKRESKGFSRVETAMFPTMLVTKQVSQGEGPTSPVGTQYTPTIIESSPHLQNISITYRKTRTITGRMGIRIPQSNVPSNAADEAITKEIHDGLEMATNTIYSLEVEQGSSNISKTQTKATSSRQSSPRASSKGGHGCQFTMGDSPVQARPERLSNLPNEPPLGEVISLKEKEASLDHKDSPKHGMVIEEIGKDENVNLVQSSEQGEAQETAEHTMDFSTASPHTYDDETLAETLLNIKGSATKDKEKAIMQESESPKKIKNKEMMQISFDEEIAKRFYKE
nr:ribonuclease H-like domain, reverse transcriptase, RNA-dependent DNA polymerase [Tanacetum cinerariifolium]